MDKHISDLESKNLISLGKIQMPRKHFGHALTTFPDGLALCSIDVSKDPLDHLLAKRSKVIPIGTNGDVIFCVAGFDGANCEDEGSTANKTTIYNLKGYAEIHTNDGLSTKEHEQAYSSEELGIPTSANCDAGSKQEMLRSNTKSAKSNISTPPTTGNDGSASFSTSISMQNTLSDIENDQASENVNPLSISSVFKENTGRNTGRNYCKFCHYNGEDFSFYTGHNLKSNFAVTCPILRDHVCTNCGATGDIAHTLRYCPKMKKIPKNKANRLSNNSTGNKTIIRY